MTPRDTKTLEVTWRRAEPSLGWVPCLGPGGIQPRAFDLDGLRAPLAKDLTTKLK